MYVVLARTPDGIVAHRLDENARPADEPELIDEEDLADWADLENDESNPRWVWDDSRKWYPQLLEGGVRIARCVDLRLSHNILRLSALTAGSRLALAPKGPWDSTIPLDLAPQPVADPHESLFDFHEAAGIDEPDPVAEFLLQREA